MRMPRMGRVEAAPQKADSLSSPIAVFTGAMAQFARTLTVTGAASSPS